MRLGNRLKVARAERSLSQERLAEIAGVTRQTISSIETGQYGPSALLAFTLAEKLGKQVDELFFLDGGSNESRDDRAGRADCLGRKRQLPLGISCSGLRGA